MRKLFIFLFPAIVSLLSAQEYSIDVAYDLPWQSWVNYRVTDDCDVEERDNRAFKCYEFTLNGNQYKCVVIIENGFTKSIRSEIEKFTKDGYEHRTDLFIGCTSDEKLHTLTKIKTVKNDKILVTIGYIDDLKFGLYIETSKYGDLSPFTGNDYEYLKD